MKKKSLLIIVIFALCACGVKENQIESNEIISTEMGLPEPTVTPTPAPNEVLEPTNTLLESELPEQETSEEVLTQLSDDILIEQLKNGNFSNLKDGDDYIEALEKIYEREKEYQDKEWVEVDLNGDGRNELIWQQKEQYQKKLKPIYVIFYLTNSEVQIAFIDTIDMTVFLFLSESGSLVRYSQYYGVFSINNFNHYIFNSDWNLKFVYGYSIFEVYDFEDIDEEYWSETYPDATELGVYYYRELNNENNVTSREIINEEQFFQGFKEMTGSGLYDLKPEWEMAIQKYK